MFIDSVKIFLKAGRGGDGCIAFRREKFVPRGGPSGGNGGNGGSIYLISDNNTDHLIHLKHKPIIKGNKGKNGKGSNRHGKNGKDIFIKVPVGTIVKDVESGKILCDFDKPEQKFLAAKGGRGGKGNASFKTSTNQAPRIKEEGRRGEEVELFLELKIIADVGLVGFPNAGKSTLISRVSKAKSKIASYPFTTLMPHPGVVELSGFRSFIMADIPGIIEGAHEGVGLGLEFLRHIERTHILLFLLDADPHSGKSLIDQFFILQSELKQYSEVLNKKSKFISVNKIDLINEDSKNLKEIENYCLKKKISLFKISALKGYNIKNMLETIYNSLKSKKDNL